MKPWAMKSSLPGNVSDHLQHRISKIETMTGSEIILSTVRRSDSYPEIPWKAFAIGVSVTGFAVFIADILLMKWITQGIILISFVTTLASGLLLVLLTMLLPGFARLFLMKGRAECEVRQYAESLFLSKEMFLTRERKGILVLVSIFEQKVVLLVDVGIRPLLAAPVMKEIIARMTPLLARKDLPGALEIALDELSLRLKSPTAGKAGLNELPDEIIENQGI